MTDEQEVVPSKADLKVRLYDRKGRP